MNVKLDWLDFLFMFTFIVFSCLVAKFSLLMGVILMCVGVYGILATRISGDD